MPPLLDAQNLFIESDGKPALKGFSIALRDGEVRELPQPAGDLVCRALAGDPTCRIVSGNALYLGIDLLALSPDERARRGVFLASGVRPSLPGVTVAGLLREALAGRAGTSAKGFREGLRSKLAALGADEAFSGRGLDTSFSSEEQGLFELLQIACFKPRLVLLGGISLGLKAPARRRLAQALAAALPPSAGVLACGPDYGLLGPRGR